MLTERQLGIVLAVVYEYIKSGEPAGSRTITKKYIKGLSPATIRNEMSDLEDMDFFYQTHTSSGRLPTAKAYRVYVDSIMQRSRTPFMEASMLEKEFYQPSGSRSTGGIEEVMERVTNMIVRLTNCVGIAAVPALGDIEIQRIDFVHMGGSSVLLIVVLKGGLVYHNHFTLPYRMSPNLLEELARRINTIASGRNWNDVRQVLYSYALTGLEEMEGICETAMKEMENLLILKNYRFFSSGAQQILKLPDFQEIGKIQAILSLLEEEKYLADMVEQCRVDNSLKVSIGNENYSEQIKDNSIIFLPAKACGQQAVIGIIGPLRMDYERSISILEGIVAAMEERENEKTT
ncbi:MAG: heat-inducible transcriptional repressor HrcA [Synergistaceae bacterium]|nr:heat-inducible transcriptional repressor HrcA [Synergistaceae bacterium]